MMPRTYRVLALLLCMAASCGFLCAQTNTITLRMLDARTGKLIETSYFLVRINHEETVHANWVLQNPNGSGKLTLPRNAEVLSIQATYDSATQYYVNCDAEIGEGKPSDRWYAVHEILTSGIVAANRCARAKDAAKFTPAPAPGVFVFFVRTRNWREQAKDFRSQ
ncbi:MAG: hypothetical protein ABSC48_05210 [Terracidiphilus sp.]